MTEAPQILLAHHLKALKLPTFLREYDKVARVCAAEGVDHPRYLMRLAEMEMIDRERRMVDRRIVSVRNLDRFPKVVPSAVDNDGANLSGLRHQTLLRRCPGALPIQAPPNARGRAEKTVGATSSPLPV